MREGDFRLARLDLRRQRAQLGVAFERLRDQRRFVEVMSRRGFELAGRSGKLELRPTMQERIHAFADDAALGRELALAVREHPALDLGGEHILLGSRAGGVARERHALGLVEKRRVLRVGLERAVQRASSRRTGSMRAPRA